VKKKEVIENFFKTNIENMMEKRSFREEPKRREELNTIGPKDERELRLKTDPFE
jgi:hypothetical protein